MSAYGYATASTYQSPRAPFQPVAPASPAVSHSYPYLPHNPSPAEVNNYNLRAPSTTLKPPLVRPSNAKWSKSTNVGRPDRFLDAQPTPVYNRRRTGHARTDSHSSSRSSYRAPSLTRSHSSSSEDEMRLPSGPNTPHSAKVALWRDDVHDPNNIPNHSGLYDQFGYLGRQHYEAASSTASSVYPSSSSQASSTGASQSAPRAASIKTGHIPQRPSSNEVEATRSSIEDLVYEFNERVFEFNFPKTLKFEEGPDCARLPYCAQNKPLIEHKVYLDELVDKLDQISSNGNALIQKSRKEAVDSVHEHLKYLNQMQKMVQHNMHYKRWKQTPRIQVTPPSASGFLN